MDRILALPWAAQERRLVEKRLEAQGRLTCTVRRSAHLSRRSFVPLALGSTAHGKRHLLQLCPVLPMSAPANNVRAHRSPRGRGGRAARKGVARGKGVSVRVDAGGPRTNKKKTRRKRH